MASVSPGSHRLGDQHEESWKFGVSGWQDGCCAQEARQWRAVEAPEHPEYASVRSAARMGHMALGAALCPQTWVTNEYLCSVGSYREGSAGRPCWNDY